jgi:2'-hydroxyisoflavone reductase
VTKELLVLGGSAFVGRALVSEGLRSGWEVTTFNRGRAASPDARVRSLIGDRLDRASLEQLAVHDWDLVIDTWSGAPRAVRDSARVLRDRAGHYAYISSESVYAPPPPLGARETSPTVDASPDAEDGTYPELKRGAELALEQELPDRSLFARAGLILGPYENVGRLTWWLARMARGGEVLCPGPVDLALQCIDARDLARFVITAAEASRTGPFNVVCRRGQTTMGTLLEACHAVAGGDDATLTWVDPDTIEAAGVQPWEELPIWIPADHEYAGMHDANVERAHDAGLNCRPIATTVTDTWAWMSTLDDLTSVLGNPSTPGLDADREQDVLHAWHSARSRGELADEHVSFAGSPQAPGATG